MSSDYDYILWLQSIQTILYKFGGPTMMGIGTIGCVLSLMVFMKKELRKNPCSMYLIAFNISNLALIYTSMLFTTLANGFGIDPSVYNLSFCHFRFYCMLLFDILSPCYLILASIDRILITSPNALTRQKSTPRLVFISISTVTVFWSLIHVAALILPNFIGLPSGYVICYFQPELYLQIMVYYSAGIKGILIPLLMIILGLWSIKNVRHIRQVAPVFTTHNEETIDRRAVRRSTSKDRQLLQILLIDISVYVIFNIMFSVVFIYQQIAKEEAATLVGSVFQNFLLNTVMMKIYQIACYYLFDGNFAIIPSTILMVLGIFAILIGFRSYLYNKIDASKEDKYGKRAQRMIDRWSGKQQQINRQNPTNEIVLNRNVLSQTYPSFYQEVPKSIPIFAECEVLVVGGGPSGISAALAAKRAGADTILLEKFGCFGGVITTVGMETIGWYRYEGTVESQGGIGIEMERIATKMGGTIKWPYNESQCLDADYFKIVADHLLTEAGVRPILHCLAVEVMLEENRIVGVITESKSGRLAIRAKRVIDCTGDADIAHLAGCSYRKTPKDEMLGVSTIFSCSNVDKERFLQYTEDNPATYADWGGFWIQETSGKENQLRSPYLDKEFQKAKDLGLIPKTSSIGGSWSSLTDAGEATNLNLVYLKNYDCTDVHDLTRAEMEGRKETLHAIMALKHTVPGFEKAKLRNFGMTLGTRDSRKIIGRYNLTGDDVKNQAKFADTVGIFPEFIDGYNIIILPTTGRYFEVPYGCLVPLEVDNLLVAGRCVAGDKISHAAMRNMMACTVTGQGAGVAAAVSLNQGVTTSEVDITLVQNELVRQGVRIH